MKRIVWGVLATTMVATACDEAGESLPSAAANGALLKSHSVTPVLLKNLSSGVRAYSLISSDDVLEESPNFVFGGSADGSGMLRNADGTYTVLVNHEDNFSVSRVTLDESLKPIAGEYIVNSTQGRWRLCSATLATLDEHGFGPLYITVGESSVESMIHAVDPLGAPGTSRLLPAFGKWNAENAVPLPKSAFPGRTAVIIGDDDSGAHGGQLAMYLSDRVGDLDGGDLYVLARVDDVTRERDIRLGEAYRVEFRRIEDQQSLTGAQINAKATELKAIAFGRTEDVDYRKGAKAGREIYFNVTGQDNTGVNADYSRSKYGRVYKLVLDANNPLAGTLEVVLDGDERGSVAGKFQNPDNILVTNNYAYIKEDPNGYGDETHDAYLYQYNLNTKELNVVAELDHRRGDATYGGDSRFGAWEYGAMIDISKTIGIQGTFLLSIQPHTWTGAKYRNPDGGTLRPNENQASQLVILHGLPR